MALRHVSSDFMLSFAWPEHHRRVEDEFDQILISAEVLGRKARKILAKSKELESRIIYVLEQNLKSEFQSTIARDWATKKDWTVEYALKVFKSLYTGMQTLE